MKLYSRLFAAGCLAMTLAAYSPAQGPSAEGRFPPENTLENWLLSGDPKLVAWGAHDALIARDQNLIPDLLSLASQWQLLTRHIPDQSDPTELSQEQMDERDAMAAVLDALIQMNVPVPADTLRTLAPDFGNAVAIFLCRMPDEEAGALSLDLYRSGTAHTYGLQYVSAARLALHPQPGFAADLLANIKVHATIYVILPGAGQPGRGFSSCCGPPPEIPREGWPATGQYALSKQQSDGALMLVAGIDPIYATRKESAHYLADECGMSMGVYLGPTERLRLIAEMLDTPPEEIPWQTGFSTTIEFQSLQQFNQALLALVEEQQGKYRATVAALAARDLLLPSEAPDALPELDLELNDMRGEGATPIRKSSNLPSHVEWTSAPF